VTRFTDPSESPDHKRLATWLIKYAQTLSDDTALHPALLEFRSPSRTPLSVADTNPYKMLSKKLAENTPPRRRREEELVLPCVETPSCTLLLLHGPQIGRLSGLALSRLFARTT
jgi:hypothetical protein